MTEISERKKPQQCETCRGKRRIQVRAGTTSAAYEIDCPACTSFVMTEIVRGVSVRVAR